MRRGEQRFDVRGGLVDDTDEEKVPDTVTGSDAVMCAVRGRVLTHRAQSGLPTAGNSEL